MHHIERQITDQHHRENKVIRPESPQKSADTAGAAAIKKELGEDSYPKALMMELLADQLVGGLSRQGNYETIDEVCGEDGAAEELASELWEYSGALGDVRIVENSSANDVLKGLDMSLLGALSRYRKKRDETWKTSLAEQFRALQVYTKLLTDKSNKTFRARELGSKEGYLQEKVTPDKITLLRSDKARYVEACRVALEEEKKKAA